MINVLLRDLVSANGTLFHLWQVESDHIAKLVSLSGPLHEPVAIDAQHVEPVEALINADQVLSFRERHAFKLIFILTERFEAYTASPSARVIISTQAVSQPLVNLIQ